MDQYLSPDQMAQATFMQLINDFVTSAAPMALRVMFFVTIGVSLLLVIIAGFNRNVERDKEREHSNNAQLTADQLRQAARFAELEEGNVFPISRAPNSARSLKTGGDDPGDKGAA